MIKNKKKSAVVIENNNEAAIEAPTFEDLNEVVLPMGNDVQDHLVKSNLTLDKPSIIDQSRFKGSFTRPASRNTEHNHSLLMSGSKSVKARSYSAAKIAPA